MKIGPRLATSLTCSGIAGDRSPAAVTPRLDSPTVDEIRASARSHRLVLTGALVLLTALTVVPSAALADTLPTISNEEASSVGVTTVKLSAEVNPNGTTGDGPTSWEIQYSPAGTDHGAEGNENWNTVNGSTIEGEAAEKSEAVDVEAIPTLEPGTEYEFRVTATNAAGQAKTAAPYPTWTMDPLAEPLLTVDPVTTGITSSGAHLSGTVDPKGGNFNPVNGPNPESIYWQFQVSGDGGANWQGVGGLETIEGAEAEKNEAIEADADASSLEPNKTYQVRLFAFYMSFSRQAFSDEQLPPGEEPPSFMTDPVAPTLTPLSNPRLKPGAATFEAEVNPGNSTLDQCKIEYGLDPGYGQSVPCSPPPPTNSFLNPVAFELTGLDAGTTYHYRAVVGNSVDTIETDDETFETLAAPTVPSCANARAPGAGQLPDCRAWEQVSPPDKHGGDVMAFAPRTRVSDDGDAVTYASLVGFADVRGTGVAVEYMAQRTPSGWLSHAITPIVASNSLRGLAGGNDAIFDGEFSPDFSTGVFSSPTPLTAAPDVKDVSNLYRIGGLRSPGEGPRQLISPCPLCAETETPLEPTSEITSNVTAFLPTLAAASPDLNHILFESIANLTEDAVPQPPFCGTDLFFPSPYFCWPQLYEWDHGTLRLAAILPDGTAADAAAAGAAARRGNYTINTISDGSDGHSRIFFVQYTDAAGMTVSEFADPESQLGVLSSPTQAARGNLFMRVDHADTVQLNSTERVVSDEFAPASFLGASRDGTRAFFVTQEALTEDARADTTDRQAYMYDATKPDTAPDNLTLLTPDEEPSDSGDVEGVVGISDDGHYVYLVVIGQLIEDGPLSQPSIFQWHDGELDEVGPNRSFEDNLTSGRRYSLGLPHTDLTPDGRYLVFSARESAGLGGYNHGFCGGFSCRELYLYSADTGEVRCTSCNPSGATATADAELTADAIHGGARNSSHQARAITDDGSRIFFSSSEALVPNDINGRSDAYQYDTETGELSLLSSGESPLDSWFVQASPDGRDVFFATNEQLVGWDIDESYDLYDARADGGLAEPSPPPPTCGGDACQPQPKQLNDPTPASSSFIGAGNPPAARRCPKGQRKVRSNRKARCQSKPKRRRAANQNRRAAR